FDGERYELASFVVMPNHVHVLFRPLGGHGLSAIVKSWKGFTAREINQRICRTGALWQDEYWDRLIRNERHYFKVAEDIRENPAKANLHDGQFILESGFSTESGLSSPLSSGRAGLENPPSLGHSTESGLSSPLSSGQGGLENPPSFDVPGRLEAKVKSFC